MAWVILPTALKKAEQHADLDYPSDSGYFVHAPFVFTLPGNWANKPLFVRWSASILPGITTYSIRHTHSLWDTLWQTKNKRIRELAPTDSGLNACAPFPGRGQSWSVEGFAGGKQPASRIEQRW